MINFFSEIISKIQETSLRLDEFKKFTNNHWVLLGNNNELKQMFIFRTNNELLISENGLIRKGKWELISHQSLLIEAQNMTHLLRHGYLDNNMMALKLDNTQTYTIFISENLFNEGIDTIEKLAEFLLKKHSPTTKKTPNSTFFKIKNQKTSKNIWGKEIIAYEVEYLDNKIGHIFHDVQHENFFFEDWFGNRVIEKEFELAAKQLYKELTNR